MTKTIDKQEVEAIELLKKRNYTDEGVFYTPYAPNDKIPDDEWKAMEYLTLNKGYKFKNGKVK